MMKTADIYIFKHAFSNNLIIIELELQKGQNEIKTEFLIGLFQQGC